jgi:transcriptional repressor NrdR
MRCPYCGHLEDRVVDSREAQDGQATRRRRECLGCSRRFTTYERIEEVLPQVVKKDGRREPFDRAKIVEGVANACQKRPVPAERLQALVGQVERELQELGEKEIRTSAIGEAVMRRLRDLDEVAYVRFASVYRAFRDVGEFTAEVEGLARPAPHPAAPPAGAGGEAQGKKGDGRERG